MADPTALRRVLGEYWATKKLIGDVGITLLNLYALGDESLYYRRGVLYVFVEDTSDHRLWGFSLHGKNKALRSLQHDGLIDIDKSSYRPGYHCVTLTEAGYAEWSRIRDVLDAMNAEAAPDAT